jgi:hypothetical protein
MWIMFFINKTKSPFFKWLFILRPKKICGKMSKSKITLAEGLYIHGSGAKGFQLHPPPPPHPILFERKERPTESFIFQGKEISVTSAAGSSASFISGVSFHFMVTFGTVQRGFHLINSSMRHCSVFGYRCLVWNISARSENGRTHTYAELSNRSSLAAVYCLFFKRAEDVRFVELCISAHVKMIRSP